MLKEENKATLPATGNKRPLRTAEFPIMREEAETKDAPRAEVAASAERIGEMENDGWSDSICSSIPQESGECQQNLAFELADSCMDYIAHVTQTIQFAMDCLEELEIEFIRPFPMTYSEHASHEIQMYKGIGSLAALLGAELFHPYLNGEEEISRMAFIYKDVLFFQVGTQRGENIYEFE